MNTLFKKLLPIFMFIICLPLTVAYGCGKKVTSVQLISSAQTFNVGDVLDNDDFSIVVTYDNKETETVKVTDSMLKESLPTLTDEGTFEIKVTYENKDYTVSITVVNPKKVESISALNYKTNYETFDTFVANGSIVVNYKDGTNATLEINNDMITQVPDLTTAGEKTVGITYMSKTYSYNITVTERTQVSYEIKDVIVDYYTTATNEDVDLVGGKLVITYSNNTSKTIDLTNDVITAYPDFTVAVKGNIVLAIDGNTFNIEVNISTDPEVLAYQKLMQAIKNVLDNGLIDNTVITGTIDINLDTRVLNKTQKIDKTIIGQTSLQDITDGYLNATTKSLIEALLENASNVSIEDIVNMLGSANLDVDELTLIVNAIQKFVATNKDFDFYAYVESNQQLKAIKDRVVFAIAQFVNAETFGLNIYNIGGTINPEFEKFVKVFEENLYADIVKNRTFDGEKLLNAIKEFAVDYANQTQNLTQENIAYRQELSAAIIKIIDNLMSREIDYNHALSLLLRSRIDYKLVGEAVYFDALGGMYTDEDVIKVIMNAEIDIIEIFENVLVEAMKENSVIDVVTIVKDVKTVLDNAITYASEKEIELVAFESFSAVLERVIICAEDGRYVSEEVANILIGLVQIGVYNNYVEYNNLLNYYQNEIALLQEDYDYYKSEYDNLILVEQELDMLIMEAEEEYQRLLDLGEDTFKIEEKLFDYYNQKDVIQNLMSEVEMYLTILPTQIESLSNEILKAQAQIESISMILSASMNVRDIVLEYVHALSFGEDVDYRTLVCDVLTAINLEDVLNTNYIEMISGIPYNDQTVDYFNTFDLILDDLNVVLNDVIYGRKISESVLSSLELNLYNLSVYALNIIEVYSEETYIPFRDAYQEVVNTFVEVEGASLSKAGKLLVNEIVNASKEMVVSYAIQTLMMLNEDLDTELLGNSLMSLVEQMQNYYLLGTSVETPNYVETLWNVYDAVQIKDMIIFGMYGVATQINPEADDADMIYETIANFVDGIENQYRNGGEPVDTLAFVSDMSNLLGSGLVAYFIDNYKEFGTPYIASFMVNVLIDSYYSDYLPEDYEMTELELDYINGIQMLVAMVDEYYLESELSFEEKDELIMEYLLTAIVGLDDIAVLHDNVDMYITSEMLNVMLLAMSGEFDVAELEILMQPISMTLQVLSMLECDITIDSYLDVKVAMTTILNAVQNNTITTKVVIKAVMNSQVLNSQILNLIAENMLIDDSNGTLKLEMLNNLIKVGVNTGVYDLQTMGQIYFDLAHSYGGENAPMYYAIGLATLVYMDTDRTVDYNKILTNYITPPTGVASIDYNILINRILTKEAIENAIIIEGINEVVTYNDQDNTLDKQELSINITFDFDVTFIVFKGNVDFTLELDF
ncbi:MAG: hypothetical protein IJW82_02515 [Clostridia bacterium]|nr:hypothetical protein [Clostridia bacterium]